MSRQAKTVRGSDNVFRDLGLPEGGCTQSCPAFGANDATSKHLSRKAA